MKYPFLNVPQTSESRVEEFGGINKNIRIGEAEFSDTKNMSCEEYPLISTRRKRTLLPLSTADSKGIIAKDDSLLTVEESGGDTMKLTVKETLPAAIKPYPPEEIQDLVYDATTVIECDMDLMELADSDGLIKMLKWSSNDDFEFTYGQWMTWICEKTGENTFNVSPTSLSLSEKITTEKNKLGLERFSLYGTITDFRNAVELTTSDVQGSAFGGGIWKGTPFKIESKITKIYQDGSEKIDWVVFVVEGIRGGSYVIAEGRTRPYIWKIRLDEESLGKVAGCEKIEIRTNFYPYIKIIRGCEKSYGEYQSEKSELEEAYKEALEQYEKDCRSELLLEEPVTAAKAKALKESARAGAEQMNVESVGKDRIVIMKPHGLIPKGTLVDTCKPYISLREWSRDGEKTRKAEISEETGERQMLSMGANVVVFPDKMRINTLMTDDNGNFTDVESLEHIDVCYKNESPNLSTQVLLCNSEYEPIPKPKTGKTKPTGGDNGEYWIDTSGNDPVLKIYSTATSTWSKTEPYLMICCYNIITDGIKKGDSIRILDTDGNNWSPEDVYFESENQSHIVYDSGTMTMPDSLLETYGKMERGYIVIKGCLKNGGSFAPTADGDGEFITIKRTVPRMNHIIECCNRLWGCYYGKDENSKNVNEIYACKQGDPSNWTCYEGTAMDSYAATLGSDGDFTGSAIFENTPVFFKENCIHRVFGSYPENYQIITQHFPGIEKGSERSVATVNGILFYKAQDGIYGYDGATSVKISDKLKERYKNAVGGSYDGVYYVSMEDEAGERRLFTYDVSRGIWHRQDNVPVKRLLNYGRDILINTDDGKLLSVDGTQGEKEADFDFLLQSGKIGYSISGKKYITKLSLQMIAYSDTKLYVDIRYDGNGDFENILTTQGGGSRSISLPIRPRRCENFEIRVYGKGEFKLISVEKTLRKGSDVR